MERFMTRFETRVDRSSESFSRQRADMLALIDVVRALEGKVRQRSERERERFETRGQLLPHERVELMLDRGAPSVEITPLAGLGMHDDDGSEEVLGGAVIARIGFVC